MRIFRRLKPSPAMTVAAVALCAALVGTAVAGPQAVVSLLDRGEKRQVKKIAKKQAKKQIKRKAPGLSVAHADNADKAESATSASNALTVSGNRVVKINFRTPGVDGPNVPILDLNGLQMKADCDGTDAILTADTTVENSEIWWTTNRSVGEPIYDGFDDFDPGEVQNLAEGKTTRDMGGEIRYINPVNQMVVVNWGADDLGGGGCNIYGFAFG